MKENLEEQLDDVTSFINGYWLFSRQSPYKSFNSIAFLLKRNLGFEKLHKKKAAPDFVTGRIAEINKPLWEILTTDKQKQTRFYKAFTSDFPINTISSDVEEKFPNVNFKKLKKLHDIKKTKKLGFNLKQKLGVVLAGTALILQTVPKKVVEEYIGPYKDFEVSLFWWSMALLGYLLLIFGPVWYSNRKASLKHDFVGEILEYIALKKE